MRALLVESRPAAARHTTALLTAANLVVDTADTGEEALDLARLYDYDAVLLALELSDLNGYEVLRRLRRAEIGTPVLVLSHLAQPQAKVKALTAGADDVLTTPCDGDELLARLRAVVRRAKGFAQTCLTVGPLTLNPASREAAVQGTPVHMTGKEFALLELLVLRKGAVVSKEGMLSHLYGGLDEPEAKIIDVFICKLRKKLAQAGAENLITTVWGRGYMLRDATPQLPTPATRHNTAQPGAAAA